jgi:hypothetical protein
MQQSKAFKPWLRYADLNMAGVILNWVVWTNSLQVKPSSTDAIK